VKYAKHTLFRVALVVTIVLALGAIIHPAHATESASVATTKIKKAWHCPNKIATILHGAGFRGHSLKIAWGLVMRESKGHARSISSTEDYGLLQLNKHTYKSQPWWDSKKLLNPNYNARVGFVLTQGGKTFYPWDISGKGKHLGRYTSNGTYNTYKNWYGKYPCPA